MPKPVQNAPPPRGLGARGALSMGRPARPAQRVAAPSGLAPGSAGGGESASGAEGGKRAGCSPGERRGSAGERALTSTHRSQGEPEQQQRLHAQPQIHAATRAAVAGRAGAGLGAERRDARRQRNARAAAGACGHRTRVAPGPRECARPSPAAGCRPPLGCSLPVPPLGAQQSGPWRLGAAMAISFQAAGFARPGTPSAPWTRLPARMLPAHSRGCIL
jgi:hypothetical protein